MERAGLAIAAWARELAAGSGKPILILAGPGNNGGDAFVAARHLKQWFHRVTVVFAHDAGKLPVDAAAAYAAWRAAGGDTVRDMPAVPAAHWGLAIDGIFGIGLTRPLSGRYTGWIATLNTLPCPVLAIDIPSGLDADTGSVHGNCARASHTLTFIGAKPGLLTLDGPDHCGDIRVEGLQLDIDTAATPGTVLNAFGGVLAPRKRNSHKGSHGSVGILGGARGMAGAALLAARAAQKLGAGRVYAGFIGDDHPPVDHAQPELMLRGVEEVLKLDNLSCLAVGPGLGTSQAAASCLLRALETKLPLVLDADALNLLAATPALQARLKTASQAVILTPHPAEAARLAGSSTSEIQANRVLNPVSLARAFNAHIVLKGVGSVCASPDRPWRVNLSGNPGMATAGMGDVLTGMIAAFLAQGAEAGCALDGAVWLHGAAADACVAAGCGPVGLTASEVIDAARRLLNTVLS
jgi:hydroxyethylthiazole kinase-like uncharacterized protein yjeF